MIVEVKNFLSAEQVSHFRSVFEGCNDFGIGSCGNRQGNTIPISGNPSLKDVDDELLEIFKRVKGEVIEPLMDKPRPTRDSGYEFHRYEKGDACKLHADTPFSFNQNGRSEIRFATVVLHLTDDKSVLVFPNQKKKIKTEAGKLVVFSPDVFHSHYSTKAHNRREIIMTWFTFEGLTALVDKR